MTADDATNREIVTVRVFHAPRETVFDAWTDPAQVVLWWGPNGFTNTFHVFEPRPGGAWRHVMHGPDGTDYPNESVFVEVERPVRIVFDHISPPRFRASAVFEDLGDQTRLTFRQVFESAADLDKVRPYAVPGSAQMLDRLAGRLVASRAVRREVVITRRFAAPRTLVWRAWTDPAHLAQWWGPHGFTNPVCEADVRPGGKLRIVMRAPDGTDYPMEGTYREVVAPERLVFTNAPLGADGNPLVEGLTTVTFTAHGDSTEVTLRTEATALAPAALGMLEGMAIGWTQTVERLAAHIDAHAKTPR